MADACWKSSAFSLGLLEHFTGTLITALSKRTIERISKKKSRFENSFPHV